MGLGMVSSSRGTVAFRLAKAGSLDPNPTTLVTKAGSAMRLAEAGSTFVTIRRESGLEHFFVTGDRPDAVSTAFALAQAISARSDVAEVPDLSRTRALATVEFQRGTEPGSNTQAGADIGTVVAAVATTLSVDEWIAVSVRAPSRIERKRHGVWLGHRGVHTHHSLSTNAVVVSVWAGADSARSAESVLARTVAALPGFDLLTQVRSVSLWPSVLPWLGGAALSGLLAVTAGSWAASVPVEIPPALLWAGVAVGLIGAALTWSKRLPSKLRRVQWRLASGLVPAPAARLLPPKRPVQARTARDGTVTQAEPGEYPLAAGAFLVGALLPLAVVAPHAGAESGVQSTADRYAPGALRSRVGPLIGSNSDLPVYLDQDDLWQGLFCVGKAGSGKSALLQALWGWSMLSKAESVSPIVRVQTRFGEREYPSVPEVHIAFDTKGDGLSANEYVAWTEAAGLAPWRLDVADRNQTTGIDLFPPVGSAKQRARQVVNALKYVYGEQSIGWESFDTLARVMHAAFLITPDVASQVPQGVRTDASAFYYANILLTNRGDELGVELASALMDKAVRENAASGTDLFDAADGLKPLYDPSRTTAQRQALVKAPRTKVAALLDAEHWWSRPHQVGWEEVLRSGTPTIINTGITHDGQTIDDELQSQMAALMLYSLREEIKRVCVGWFERGAQVVIFADELKQLAGTSPDVVSWFRNDARSFGVRAVFATQYPEQLDRDVRDAVLGFGTFIAYAQSNPDMIATIIKHLQVDGSVWEPADIDGLPRFTAVVKTQVDGQSQTPFTVQIPDFRSMRGDEFRSVQGVGV